MIVQTAVDGEKHFVMTMGQHTALSAQFAEHFGNASFEPLEPRSQMLHVIEHHDAGWRELDALALRDPATGLPYNLVQTPFERIIETSSASPDFNGTYHPYCELLSSMHSWGLYNGRYGMSEKVLLDGLAEKNRAIADRMFDHEITRQERLKATLESDPDTAGWIEESHLFQNYKQLQFFDTLALYFNCVQQSEREKASFSHVPLSATEDTEVDILPGADGVYALDPYPFDQDDIAVRFDGHYLAPIPEGDDVRAELNRALLASQTARLVATT
ncbi:MAG: DUF3891 family protein [Proteobacteria bacterium]|nr:DUF3891 family protein [Pseudomonadota bacterium]